MGFCRCAYNGSESLTATFIVASFVSAGVGKLVCLFAVLVKALADFVFLGEQRHSG